MCRRGVANQPKAVAIPQMHILIIIIIIITATTTTTFTLTQEIGLTESLSNWRTFTDKITSFICHYTDFRNGECPARIGLFISRISIITLSLYNLHDGYKFDIMYKDSA